jgi:hypothetical protein
LAEPRTDTTLQFGFAGAAVKLEIFLNRKFYQGGAIMGGYSQPVTRFTFA